MTRKRRSDAEYASNAERQRAYRARKRAARLAEEVDWVRAEGAENVARWIELMGGTSQMWGLIGNLVKQRKHEEDLRYLERWKQLTKPNAEPNPNAPTWPLPDDEPAWPTPDVTKAKPRRRRGGH